MLYRFSVKKNVKNPGSSNVFLGQDEQRERQCSPFRQDFDHEDHISLFFMIYYYFFFQESILYDLSHIFTLSLLMFNNIVFCCNISMYLIR